MTARLDHYPMALARYLGMVQFFLLLSWTVYAIYLPELLEAVGVDRHWTGWVLLADQVLFACFDVAAGFMADRAFRLYAKIGYTVVTITFLSCLAFVALPLLPRVGAGPEIFLAITALWAISSSALRSPLFGLLARHAATPEVPQLAALSLVGMGLAAAASPYLGTVLKGEDPRLPFLIASLALMATAVGVIRAERHAPAPSAPPATPKSWRLPSWVWLPGILLAALAFQIAVFINAGPRYLREVDPVWLPWLMPVFWSAFSLVVFGAGRLAKRWGSSRLFVAGCLTAAAGVGLTGLPGIAAAIGGYVLAGFGWGAILPSAFGMAAESGSPGRLSTYTGLLFAALASAAFLRIGVKLSGLPAEPGLAQTLSMAPSVIWLVAGFWILLIVYSNLLGLGWRVN
ncbi:MFS transporter [Rhabdochromatium marinum]|uniref:MFS transporter n=1 Tax=Rhabdochromatium marinum TaxID=48729 RepID=UPI001905ECA6|nr:MFS transporter [Rhabdochromatium marinum]MBK1648726.1 MFS transporter [Rhabdochromatium marinum]